MNNFSPNMLKTYQTCPRKFYYRYIEKINMPQYTTPFETGKKIHALASYYLQGVNISRIEKALNNEEEILWQRLLQNEFFQKDCLKTEFSLSVKIKKYWIGGRIDAIVHKNRDYYILDYKTGSIPNNPEKDFQTLIYLLCADKYIKKYDSLSFVYINLKEYKNHIIEFNNQQTEKYQRELKEICSTIINDRTYCRNKSNCHNCEYSKICSI